MEHKHFIGSAHAFEILTDKDPTAGQFVRPDVTILKTFFINDKVNLNDWQATWEGLKSDAEELPGVPLVLKEDLEHPKFSVQEMYDRGTIFDYDIDEENRQIIVYVRITDPTVAERIKSGELQYVSPAVIPKSDEALRNVEGVEVLDRTLPLHLAIVSDPAYGKDAAKMTHLCSGDGKECYHRLKTMTASKKFREEEEKKAEGEGDGSSSQSTGIKSKLKIKNAEQGIPQLEQTPLIKKLLASAAKIASVMDKISNNESFYVHEGQIGNWIRVQGMDVFVARNQSIKEAMLKQCGCTKLT